MSGKIKQGNKYRKTPTVQIQENTDTRWTKDLKEFVQPHRVSPPSFARKAFQLKNLKPARLKPCEINILYVFISINNDSTDD